MLNGCIGIIAEYNPFHKGHLYHIKKARRDTGLCNVIAVMSGGFVQRGEPAICDKWARARMALNHGIDLVIELPVAISVSGTGYFAKGAVKLLAGTNIVSLISFGSETGDITSIKKAGRILSNEGELFNKNMQTLMAEGNSYAKARGLALAAEAALPKGFFTKPNDTLGMEYYKSLLQLDANINVHAVKRGRYISASAIRELILAGRYEEVKTHMPKQAYEALVVAVLADRAADCNNLNDIAAYLLRTMNQEALQKISGMSEGLENRFVKMSGLHKNIADLLDAVKTKRYTHTRIKRALISLILGITADMVDECSANPPYIRVLGFKKEKGFLLSQIAKKASLPVITNIKNAGRVLDDRAMQCLKKEIEASDIYALAAKSIKKINNEYSMPLVIV